MLGFKDAGRVRLISRAGRDHTKRFRQIVDALTDLQADTFTLDGEVAVFDQELVSRLEWLRQLTQGDLATPPLYMVFDLLHLGEQDYRAEPLRIRRRALEKLVKGQSLILPARRPSPNGFAAWTEVLHRGVGGDGGQGP
jgi:bifunctional non-homologous end joining protein LigD